MLAMTLTEQFLSILILVFSIPFLIWRLGNTDNFAPLVVIQIITGVLLGPGVSGEIFPEIHAAIFSPEVTLLLKGIASWAIMLFVWSAGIELDLTSAWNDRKHSFIAASFALGFPFILGSLVAMGLVSYSGWVGKEAETWQFVMGIGMSCAVTALPILLLFMEKLQILRMPLGQRILRYASLDDIAIWAILALILMQWDKLLVQGLFVAGFVLISIPFRKLMVALDELDRLYVGLIWLTINALLADLVGLHYMVGAFLAGVVIDRNWFCTETFNSFRKTVLLTIMPVFFLSTGLQTDWTLGGLEIFVVSSLLLISAVLGKLVGTQIVGSILRWPMIERRVVGWLLQTKALIMIIFANVLLEKELITSDTFTALLFMAVMSTILTMPMVNKAISEFKGLGHTVN